MAAPNHRIDYLRRRLALGQLGFRLELADPLLQHQRLGPPRRIAGSALTRCVRCAGVGDADHAGTLRRREIADIDRSGWVGPRVDVRVSGWNTQGTRDEYG